MRKLLLGCLSIAVLFLQAGLANALTITQTHTFSVTSSALNPVSVLTNPIEVAPFDPSLGTLDEVRVSIGGLTHVDFAAHPLYPGPEPVPYALPITVGNRFVGNYFAFDTPAAYGWVAQANTTVFSFDNAFTYDFVFDGDTDQSGTTSPTVTNTAAGYGAAPSISGYLASFTGFPSYPMFIQNAQAFATTSIMQFSISTNGSMTVEYDYTPASTPVPEPATLLLLGAGLAGLAGSRIRRRKG